jgi:hypothetical protein
MWKMANNKNNEGPPEELDNYLSTIITKVTDLERHIDLFAESLQSACKRTFQNINAGQKNSKKKTVPWWTDRQSHSNAGTSKRL